MIMKQRAFFVIAVFLVFSSFAISHGADNQADLQVELSAHRIVATPEGKEKKEPADKAAPGDVVEYIATYKNRGNSEARNVAATLPVPQGMEYVAGTARPEKVSASLDGKTFAPAPLKRKVRLSNGREEVREVSPSEYRALRWDLRIIAAGKSAAVTARMRVAAAGAPLSTQDLKVNTK